MSDTPGNTTSGSDAAATDTTVSDGGTTEAAKAESSATETASSDEAETKAASETPKTKAETTAEAKKDGTFWYWAIGIVFLLCMELYIYGRNGLIEVCVGIDGVTDFAFEGQPRSKDMQRKVPFCASRLNLGMYNHSEEQATAALRDACARATMTNKPELAACLNRDKKWTRRVTKDQVPPWDKRLYRRLLWLE